MSGGISPGQESGTVLGYSDKYVNKFKLGFDVEIELSFSIGPSKGFKYDRLDWLPMGV